MTQPQATQAAAETDPTAGVDPAVWDHLAAFAATSGRQLVDHLRRGGASLPEALRLGMAAVLVSQFGPSVLSEMGMPARSSVRIRARIVELLEAAGEPTAPSASRFTQRHRHSAAS